MAGASIFFVIIQSVMLILGLYLRSQLEAINRFHFVVKMLLASIVLLFIHSLLSVIYWSSLFVGGLKNVDMLFASHFFFQLSGCLYIVMMILIAKGWKIVRKHLSAMGKTKLVAYSSFYVLALTFATFYEVYSYDPSIISYRYNTGPGVLLVLLRVFGLGWFLYAIYTTKKQFPHSKKGFYIKLSLAGTLWFLYMPLFALISLGIHNSKNLFVVQTFTYCWENVLMVIGWFKRRYVFLCISLYLPAYILISFCVFLRAFLLISIHSSQ